MAKQFVLTRSYRDWKTGKYQRFQKVYKTERGCKKAYNRAKELDDLKYVKLSWGPVVMGLAVSVVDWCGVAAMPPHLIEAQS